MRENVRRTTDIKTAADVLLNGGVIAYPTETLPGLGCQPDSDTAIRRLLQIKQRPADKGLILLASRLEQLQAWIAPLNAEQQKMLQAPADPPTTWLVPAAANSNELVRGKHDRIAVRITTHPVAIALCDRLGSAITSTSANLAGEPAATDIDSISPALAAQLDLVLTGPKGTGKPSRIRDLLTGQVLR